MPKVVHLLKNLYLMLKTIILTCRNGKEMLTIKLETQLTSTPMFTAAARGPWGNSSATIIQGMEPADKEVIQLMLSATQTTFGVTLATSQL